jgi:hypothetical protein
MTGRLLINEWRCDVADYGESAEKCRDSDCFEPVVRRATSGHLAAQGRALPCLNQQRGELRSIEVCSNLIGATLPGSDTGSECRVPAVENADEFGAYRFTRTPEFKRQIADQAAEQKIAGLMFVRERMKEAGYPLLRQPVGVKEW